MINFYNLIMQVDVKFYIIILGFIASILPLIFEIVILPTKFKKYESKDAIAFNQVHQKITNLAFFYFLFIAFMISLWDYFSAIIIEHPILDFSVFLCLVIVTILGIRNYDYKEKVLDLSEKRDGKIFYTLYIFLSFPLLISLIVANNSDALIDKPFAIIIVISIFVQILIFDRFKRNIF